VHPLPPAPLAIYSQDYFDGANEGHGYVEYDRDKQTMVPSFNQYLHLIEKAYGKKGRLLDVGAATGFFLDLARARGWETAGVEPSDYAAGLGRAKGLDVRTGTLDAFAADKHSFDAITLWDVIEHVPDPRETMRQVRELLKPGGIVAINTPDADSLWARMMGMQWHLIVPPEHLHLFGTRSLQRLLAGAELECLMTAKIGKTFTLQYVIHTLAHWRNIQSLSRLADSLSGHAVGRIGLPINLRDNVFLLGRSRS
jgi:2-polyprenyl-3-methyl-5-hydroxy-6-metoxy-1,4-benzoquinol methylase